MAGYAANKGLVPQICEALFKGIKTDSSNNKENQYEVIHFKIDLDIKIPNYDQNFKSRR
jgi:hypothetical protein